MGSEMCIRDRGADGDVFQGLTEERGLGVHKGDESVVLEFYLTQELNFHLHGPDEFLVLLAEHPFRGDEGEFFQTHRLSHDFPQGHRRGDGIRITYAPDRDGDPDAGEVVWTWVPYVENDGRGKDRPVLIIARLAPQAVAGCYLSTKRHDGFISVGSGAWDAQGRESLVNPGRILYVPDSGMRREGHVVPPERFDQAVRHIAALHGLSA